MATCTLCAGSGRDIVTPATRRCPICGGSGWVLDEIKQTVRDPRPPRDRSDAPGCAMALLALALIAGLVIVGAGYVVSSEMLWHYWVGGRYAEHHWDRVAIYAVGSLAAVALVARYFGFLVGAAVGVIPALPLQFATQGTVGFWFIAFHGEEDPLDNVTTSWIALVGTLAIHVLVALAVQHRNESVSYRMLRWRWIKTPAGLISSVVLSLVCVLATSNVMQALEAF